jgi:hypothetical protein
MQNPRRQLAPPPGASSGTGFDCGSRVAESRLIVFFRFPLVRAPQETYFLTIRRKNMYALKNLDYVTDKQGKKKSVVLKVTDFTRMREDMEDLEDALELEKARKVRTAA